MVNIIPKTKYMEYTISIEYINIDKESLWQLH